MGFIASMIYRATPSGGVIRAWMAIILAAPTCVLPILCVVSDGPDMLALAWRYHIFSAWLLSVVVYILAVASVGFVRCIGAEPPDPPESPNRAF